MISVRPGQRWPGRTLEGNGLIVDIPAGIAFDHQVFLSVL